MADNKVIELQKQILELTKVINDNGKATKEQADKLKNLVNQYDKLGGKLMPQYRKRNDEVAESLKKSEKITSKLDKTNKLKAVIFQNTEKKNEFERDRAKGLDTAVPENYFPDDDPSQDPVIRWRAHASLLFSNWLNYYVYQVTPYDWK